MRCGGGAGAFDTRRAHEPIVHASVDSNSPGQQPDSQLIGSTVVLAFTLNTDSGYRKFKIPANFVGNPSWHVHWTKQGGAGGDGDESGNAVRWRITYQVFAGGTPGGDPGDDLTAGTTVLEVEDTYDDAGTTTRIVYRTPNVAAPGFVAGYYVGVCVEAITPVGTAMGAEPALVSLDLTYDEYPNQ